MLRRRRYVWLCAFRGETRLTARRVNKKVTRKYAMSSSVLTSQPSLLSGNARIWQGIMFEVNYSQALGSAQSRRFVIGNSVSLSRVTMGKQTVHSSGALDPMVSYDF